jgi:hypothetical protein
MTRREDVDDVSRRKLLVTGGAVGAIGALGLAAPAGAAPWTWTPRGSVAGEGTGADPRWVWDEEADPLVASLLERGEVPRVNTLLRTWTKNGQPLPDGLPADLRDFMERARQLPSWVDHGKLATAVEFNKKRGTYLGLLYGLGSGMMSTVIPREARAVYYSAGGADMKDRISKTAKLGYDIGSLNAFQPTGEMVVTSVKTRLVHAAVRHLLPQSPHWQAQADEEIPISQRDIMVTWHSLPTFVMQKMAAWRIRISGTESDAFLHSWQVGAHLLGVRDEYIPATWDEARAQSTQVLDPLLGPTPEGVKLADILLDLAAAFDGGVASRPFLESMTRYVLGDRIAEWLEIPAHPGLDRFIASSWPVFVAFKEGGPLLPFAPEGYWTFDEFLRQGALFFLSEGKPISIEIPTGNNPRYGG